MKLNLSIEQRLALLEWIRGRQQPQLNAEIYVLEDIRRKCQLDSEEKEKISMIPGELTDPETWPPEWDGVQRWNQVEVLRLSLKAECVKEVTFTSAEIQTLKTLLTQSRMMVGDLRWLQPILQQMDSTKKE